MASSRKAGESVSLEEMRRRLEERIETGRRPRRPRFPDELEAEFARRGEEAAASWAAWERSRREEMLRYLRESGQDELADEFEDMWTELQTYRRAVERRNARTDGARANRRDGLMEYCADRPPIEAVERIKRQMRKWLTEPGSEARNDPKLAFQWAVLRFGTEYEEGEDGRKHKRVSGRYSHRHLRRLLSEVAGELSKAPGRE